MRARTVGKWHFVSPNAPERLRAGVEANGVSHEGAEFGVVTLSAGLALASPEIGSSPAGLLKAAGTALYEAQRAGHNRVSVG